MDKKIIISAILSISSIGIVHAETRADCHKRATAKYDACIKNVNSSNLVIYEEIRKSRRCLDILEKEIGACDDDRQYPGRGAPGQIKDSIPDRLDVK